MQDNLKERIFNVSRITGTFTLRSGTVSNEYFDKYLFEAEPAILNDVCCAMLPLIPKDTEVLAGLEMGGIPIATILSAKSGLPCAFVRKQAKEYGTRKIAEGADISGKKVCIIEDVVTTGGAIINAVSELREHGASVDTVLCCILRDIRAKDILRAEQLTLLPLF